MYSGDYASSVEPGRLALKNPWHTSVTKYYDIHIS